MVEATITEVLSPEVDRAVKVERLVNAHVLGSAGIGLIPIPIADFAGLTALQVNMLKKITELYGVDFKKEWATYIVGSLVGSVVPAGIGTSVARIVSLVPLVGPLMGVATMPLLAGASTYALARVMIQHLESGGTFLTFDPQKVKGFFKEQFESGKAFVKNLTHKSSNEAEAAPVEAAE